MIKRCEPQLRALMFTALVATNISLILVNRSFDASLLHAFSRRNPSLWILLSAVSALLVLLLNWDGARSLFHFDALNSWQWALCFGLAAANLVGLESLKQLWFARIWQSAR